MLFRVNETDSSSITVIVGFGLRVVAFHPPGVSPLRKMVRVAPNAGRAEGARWFGYEKLKVMNKRPKMRPVLIRCFTASVPLKLCRKGLANRFQF